LIEDFRFRNITILFKKPGLIFDIYDRLYFPINMSGVHWFLAEINENKEIVIYDSLNS